MALTLRLLINKIWWIYSFMLHSIFRFFHKNIFHVFLYDDLLSVSEILQYIIKEQYFLQRTFLYFQFAGTNVSIRCSLERTFRYFQYDGNPVSILWILQRTFRYFQFYKTSVSTRDILQRAVWFFRYSGSIFLFDGMDSSKTFLVTLIWQRHCWDLMYSSKNFSVSPICWNARRDM